MLANPTVINVANHAISMIFLFVLFIINASGWKMFIQSKFPKNRFPMLTSMFITSYLFLAVILIHEGM